MSKHTPSQATHPKGFTLIEILVVMALASVLLTALAVGVRMRQQDQAATSYITLQAREMAEFAKAVEAFAAEQKGSWATNVRQTITPAQLVTAGKLATTWAQRGGTGGVTPVGETYRAFAIKDAAGVARIVTADFGRNPTDSLVRRAGYQATATSLQGYKARVSDEMTKQFGGYAAYVTAGTMTARGPTGGFTQDIATYFGNSAPALPVAVELVGWPEYRRPGTGGESGGSFSCDVLQAEGADASLPYSGPSGTRGQGACWLGTSSRQPCFGHDPTFGYSSLTYHPPQCPTKNGVTPTPTRIPMCSGGASTVLRIREGFTLAYALGAETLRRMEYWTPACGGAEVSLTTTYSMQSFVSNGITQPPYTCGQLVQNRGDNVVPNQGCSVITGNVPNPLVSGVYRNGNWHQIPNASGFTNADRTHIACCYSIN